MRVAPGELSAHTGSVRTGACSPGIRPRKTASALRAHGGPGAEGVPGPGVSVKMSRALAGGGESREEGRAARS